MFSLKTLVPFLVIPFYATFLFVFLNNSVYAADLGLKLNKNLQSVVQDAQANQLKYVNNYHQTLILNNNELQKNKENAEVLVKDRNYESLGGKTMVINYLNNLSDEQKATIIATGVGGAVEIQGRQYFLEYVDNDDTVNTIAERETYAPEIISQLNYLYETDAWGTPSGGRVVPDDYNTTTHWNLEKIKTPESWNDLGGCQSDTLCGGDPTIKVAVIDTGVAYEDFDYDAGATYTNKKLATLGFNMEVTSGTADGEYNEGYDRRYAKSPELDNATFTDPYDAAWDVLCDYRSLESNSSDRCNAAELAKVDHANDDYGHGTFVTQIINSDTGTDAATNRIVGIAHNVQIMPIKVSYPYDRSFCFNSDGTYNSTCSNSDYDYRGAITSLALVAGIDAARINGADVVNMSLAGNGVSTLEEEAMQEALDADIILIAASGNDGTSGDNVYPAAYTGVVILLYAIRSA